jgi:methylated-DNA-[protein]-cysteine S-methyltransferase
MWVHKHDSPIGPLTLVADDQGLRGVFFPGHKGTKVPPASGGENGIIAQTRRELDGYFAGTLRQFAVPLAPQGTAFQRRVWDLLRDIGYGERRSYADLAHQLGQPTAARAVGAAVGRNPLSILVPCHRVVGSSGALTGFAGGLERKAHLLALETGSVLPLVPKQKPRGG